MKTFFYKLLICFSVISLISCIRNIEIENNTNGKYAVVRFTSTLPDYLAEAPKEETKAPGETASANAGRRAARYICPQNVSVSSFKYRLTCYKGTATSPTVDETYNDNTALQGASINLEEGTYKFTLEAINSSNQLVFQQTITNKQISIGPAVNIEFQMEPLASGDGSYQIDITINKTGWYKVAYQIGDITGETTEAELIQGGVSAPYILDVSQQQLSKGDYSYAIWFYQDEDTITTIDSGTLKIIPNAVSTATYEINEDQVNRKFTITYKDDIYDFYSKYWVTSNRKTSASIYEVVNLPDANDIHEQGRVFLGWSTEKNDPTKIVTQISDGGEGIKQDHTVYAIWGAPVLYVKNTGDASASTASNNREFGFSTGKPYGTISQALQMIHNFYDANNQNGNKDSVSTWTIKLLSNINDNVISFNSSQYDIYNTSGNPLSEGEIGTQSITICGEKNDGSTITRVVTSGEDYKSVISISDCNVKNVYLKDLRITGAKYLDNGGGISCTSSVNLYLENCFITGNKVNEKGGAIYVNSSSQEGQNSTDGANLFLYGTTQIGNPNTTSGSANVSTKIGGGIYCGSKDTLYLGYEAPGVLHTLTGGVYYNRASCYSATSGEFEYGGGGIFCYNMYAASGEIKNNSTGDDFIDNYGGGILCRKFLDLHGSCVIENNKARNGAGISLNTTNSDVSLYAAIYGDVIIDKNSSENSASCGGGIYVDDKCQLCLYGNAIIGDKTLKVSEVTGENCGNYSVNGGGIYVNGTGNLYIGYKPTSGNGTTTETYTGGLYGNYAQSGGGIFTNSTYAGDFFFNEGFIANNVAENRGGGIYKSNSSGVFTLNGGVISKNVCKSTSDTQGGGGAIYTQGDINFNGTSVPFSYPPLVNQNDIYLNNGIKLIVNNSLPYYNIAAITPDSSSSISQYVEFSGVTESEECCKFAVTTTKSDYHTNGYHGKSILSGGTIGYNGLQIPPSQVCKLAKGTDGSAGDSYDYVYFGTYPQSMIPGKAFSGNPPDTKGDYKYYTDTTDGYHYVKVKPQLNTANGSFLDGSAIDSNVNYYFRVEPIKWRVSNFTTSEGYRVLIPENILDAGVPYFDGDETRTYNSVTITRDNYSWSVVRYYLNNELSFVSLSGNSTYLNGKKGFLYTAFTGNNNIPSAIKTNYYVPTLAGQSIVPDTDDEEEDKKEYVGLLHEWYFNMDSNELNYLKKIPTDYAKCRGLKFDITEEKGGSYYISGVLRNGNVYGGYVNAHTGNSVNIAKYSETSDKVAFNNGHYGLVPIITVQMP